MLLEKIELESDEIILKTVRKHWFLITIEIISTLFFALFPIFIITIFILIPQLHPSTFVVHEALPLIYFGISFWCLFTTLAVFMIWTHYFLDLWIITDRRIIVIDQIRFFNRKVSSFRLERLQDVKAQVDGIIPTLLNFGTLQVQTASAEETSFISRAMPDPRELQALIQKATDERLQSLHGASLQTIID